jgi:glycosyltransferase involved in cell wall biosynthesis
VVFIQALGQPAALGQVRIVNWWLVLPSLRVSGGNIEILRLGRELARGSKRASLLSLWTSPHELESALDVHRLSDWISRASRAPFQYPSLICKFRRWLRSASVMSSPVSGFIFTHYSTLPFAWLVPRARRYFFVQDLEWNFIPQPQLSRLLRGLILRAYRSGSVIAANSYLCAALTRLEVPVAVEMPVWADAGFRSEAQAVRDIDFVMVLRHGAHKRLDLYLSFIATACKDAGVRVAVISPEEGIVERVRGSVAVVLLRPTMQAMRELYSRARCFVHLSDHEGFGLPPLEAMGAGCVPLCRDSGGVRAFMTASELRPLLLPLDLELDEIYRRGRALLADEPRFAKLSSLSRAVFEGGLEATQRARTEAVIQLNG